MLRGRTQAQSNSNCREHVMGADLASAEEFPGLYEKLAKRPMTASLMLQLERVTSGVGPLSRALRLTAMLWVDHLTKFKQSRRTHAWVMDECNSDHSHSWVDVTCFLTK